MALNRIVSGGQTGADQAALDVALFLGLEVGGWVPKGRTNENGLISSHYPNLCETQTVDSDERTRLNVVDSDATLIVSHGELLGGSEKTRAYALEAGKPFKHLDLDVLSASEAVIAINQWLSAVQPSTLNVAGSRESEDPRIYAGTQTILKGILMTDFDPNIVCQLRESVLAQCGRWDQIRWAVPSWFTAVAAIPIAFADKLGKPESLVSPRQVFASVGFFGLVCALLLIRLMWYEHRLVRDFNRELLTYRTDSNLRRCLEIHRPFGFTFPRILVTASFWFLFYTLVLALALLKNAFV
jgi:Circularly permutated YpsA SLOG family